MPVHILLRLQFDSFSNFWSALVIVPLFLSFDEVTKAYLLKTWIIHNLKRVPLLYLLIYCIPARAASHMLSLEDEYTWRFLNFLIVVLCNSLYSFCFCIAVSAKIIPKKIVNHWSKFLLISITLWIICSITCFTM